MAKTVQVGDVVQITHSDDANFHGRLGVLTDVEDVGRTRVAGVWVDMDTGFFFKDACMVTVAWRPDRRIVRSAGKVAKQSPPEHATRDWKRVIVATWREHTRGGAR